MRLFRISADDPLAIVEVDFGQRERLPVDDPDQRPQRQSDENHKARRKRRVQRMAAARQQPRGRRRPQRGGGVEAGGMQSLAKNDSGTEKADAGDSLGRHPRAAILSGKQARENDRTCRIDHDQRIGPQTGRIVLPDGERGTEILKYIRQELPNISVRDWPLDLGGPKVRVERSGLLQEGLVIFMSNRSPGAHLDEPDLPGIWPQT